MSGCGCARSWRDVRVQGGMGVRGCQCVHGRARGACVRVGKGAGEVVCPRVCKGPGWVCKGPACPWVSQGLGGVCRGGGVPVGVQGAGVGV